MPQGELALPNRHSGSLPVRLAASQASELAERSVALGATPFMTLLTVFQTLLARYSGQSDISVGTPIAGRHHHQLEGLVGCCVNTLVMRAQPAPETTFRQLLGQVREASLEGYSHQDVPFERLVEELRPSRNLAYAPLFQVMLSWQDAHWSKVELQGLQTQLEPVPLTAAKFDLSLLLESRDESLSGTLEYAAELFDPVTIERFWGHLQNLLDSALETPERRLAELRWWNEGERQQVLAAWDPELASTPSSCLSHKDRAALSLEQLLLSGFDQHPDRVALVTGSTSLSYGELGRQVTKLSARLRELEIGEESRVGVCLERRAELLITLLAILDAGAAYVPLDPAYPPSRLGFMLADSEASLVVSEASLRSRVSESGVAVLDVDEALLETQTGRTRKPLGSVPYSQSSLSHVIYTSGSTGRPKGVGITRGGVASLLGWVGGSFTEEELSGMLAATSISFDLSVFELFGPLAWGGTVYLAADALALTELADRDRIRVVNTVPSAMSELVALKGVPRSVTTVGLAGEPLRRSLSDAVYESTATTRLLNLYGPSEETTYSTGSSVGSDSTSEPTIGRPLVGTSAWLLDRKRYRLASGASSVCPALA